jgi:hypothetical protein
VAEVDRLDAKRAGRRQDGHLHIRAVPLDVVDEAAVGEQADGVQRHSQRQLAGRNRDNAVDVDCIATMEDGSRTNAQKHALPAPCARATIEADKPTQTKACWMNPVQEGTDMTFQHNTPIVPDRPSARPGRRFSEGIERMPLAPSSWRVGSYSDGLARSPRTASARRIGSFADGLMQRPDAAVARRVGSFSDGLERGAGHRGSVQRVDSQRSGVDERIAA